MRRLFMVGLVAAMAGLLPAIARAGNQEAADQIATYLRQSGQLSDYKVGVRYLDGTVWLQGRVHDEEQLNRAVSLVFSTPDISVMRVIKDDLKVGTEAQLAAETSTSATRIASPTAANPLRTPTEKAQAQALASSFSASRAAMPVAMMQPIPPAPIASPAAAPAPAATPRPLPPVEATSGVPGPPLPMYAPGTAAAGTAPVRYDQPCMPNYAWPSYAAYPNYAAVTYPKQYSPTAWPYIGPFYPYPQVPLGWRKVSLTWDDGWWWLNFNDKPRCCWWR